MLICIHICEAAQPFNLVLISCLFYSILVNLRVEELNEIDVRPHDQTVKVVPIEVWEEASIHN
jgi:hypothetical protein